MTHDLDHGGVEAALPYPAIAAACFLIALDNGGINRGRSERKWRSDYRRFIGKQDGPLTEIDTWLASLTKQQMETVCAGEDADIQAALHTAPAFTGDLLALYFDEVC